MRYLVTTIHLLREPGSIAISFCWNEDAGGFAELKKASSPFQEAEDARGG